MTVNKELLRKAVEWVEWQDTLEPGQRAWVQDYWITIREEEDKSTCGTAYCVAGYIGAIVAPQVYAQDDYGVIDGENLHVSDFATMQLGHEENLYSPVELSVNNPDAGWRDGNGSYVYNLFHSENTARDIRTIAEAMAGGPL